MFKTVEEKNGTETVLLKFDLYYGKSTYVAVHCSRIIPTFLINT